MKTFFRTTFLMSSLAMSVGLANAAEGDISITPLLGYQTYDNQFKNGVIYGLGLGYGITDTFAVELKGFYDNALIIDTGSPVNRFSNADTIDTGTADVLQASLALQYWIPTESLVKPFLSYGLGVIDISSDGAGDNSVNTASPSQNTGGLPKATSGSFITNALGVGLGYDLTESLQLRADFNYLMWDMHHGVNEVDDLQYALGLSWLPLGEPAPVVEPTPMDSDLDGIFDDADQCPGTAPGLVVDAAGCPIDSDLDGIFDGADQCPNTAAGVMVDAVGCEIIEEPVVLDTDGDGVLDDVDLCPSTLPGVAVDASGCDLPKVLTEQVSMQLAVYFESGSAVLTPESYSEVASLADFMNEYPTTAVVVEGHTDSQGAAAFNQNLSQERADAVAYALTSQYGIDYSRVTAVGYGEEYPIADNSTRDGRALNRRVVAVINETVSVIE